VSPREISASLTVTPPPYPPSNGPDSFAVLPMAWRPSVTAGLSCSDHAGSARMNTLVDVPNRFATAIAGLVEVIDDTTAGSRERLHAARMLKTCLVSLQRLVESSQTSPELRKAIVEVLRAYRRS
jgi:hypothetical protein